MPIIPNQGPAGQQPSRTQSTFRVSGTDGRELAAAGRDVNRGVQAVLGAGLGALAEVQRDRDEMDALEALSGTRQFLTTTLYDPESGALTRTGRDAQNLTQSTETEIIGPELQRVRDGLSRNAQRIFDFRIAGDLTGAYRQMASHEARQLEAGLRESRRLNLDTVSNNIAIAHTDMEGLEAGLAELDTAVDETFQNLTDEGVEIMRAQVKGQALSKRAALAIKDGNLAGARVILDVYGDQMDATSRDGLRRTLEDTEFATVTTRAAAVVARAADVDSIADAKALTTAEVERRLEGSGIEITTERQADINAAVEAQIKARDDDAERVRDRVIGREMSGMQDAIVAHGLGERTDADGNPITVTYQDVFAQYSRARQQIRQLDDDKALEDLDAVWQNFAEDPRSQGYAIINDPDTLDQLVGLTDSQLASMTDEQVNALRGRLTKQRHDELREDVAEARNGGSSSTTSSGEKPLTHGQLVETVRLRLKDAGIVNQSIAVPFERMSEDQRRAVQIAVAQVTAAVPRGERDFANVSKAISDVVLEKRFERAGWFSPTLLSVADFYTNPRRIESDWPDAWRLIEAEASDRKSVREAQLSDQGWLQETLERIAPALNTLAAGTELSAEE